jgi:acyl dehydratase
MSGKTIDGPKVGDRAEFAKTIAESDGYIFAGVTGDLYPFHVNEDYSRDTAGKNRVVLTTARATGTAAWSPAVKRRSAYAENI